MLVALPHAWHASAEKLYSWQRRCSLQQTADHGRPRALPRAAHCAAGVTTAGSQPRRCMQRASAAAGDSALVCDTYMQRARTADPKIKFQGVHHVAVVCANLEQSLDFYCGLLGELTAFILLNNNYDINNG